MKKRKLLFSIVALLCSVGAWAQASYNYSYKNGVTVAAGDNYFLYNIGSGMFLTDGMDYGTHASVDHGGRVLTLAANTNGFSIYTKPYSTNGSDEKKGYLTTNGYVDTGSNDADWVFTPVSVAGYTNVYTIKNSESQYLYWECKDGLYESKAGQFINVGETTNDEYSYWLLIPLSSRQAVNDYTYLLRNTEFQHPWELQVWENTASWTNYCGGNKENTCAEMISAAFDVSQTISVSVPNGKYVLYNQGFYRANDATKPAYLYANRDTKAMRILNSESEGTSENMSGASTSFSAGKYVNSVSTIVTSNSLTVGVKTEGTNWTIFDNFYLEYLGNSLSVVSTEFRSGGSALANTWYAFTVPSTGWYTITSTSAGTFTFSQDGSENFESVTSRFYATTTGKYQYLSAGTFYFKTNTAATVTIAATSVHSGNDVTGYINDPSFEHVALSSSGTVTSTDLMDWTGTSDATEAFISYKIKDRLIDPMDGNNLYNTWGGSPSKGFYLNQTLSNLPIGLYRLTCRVASDNNKEINVALGASSVNTTCTGGGNGILATVDLNNTSVGDVLINLTSSTWFKADDFKLTLVANQIVNDAVELPVGGAMTANTWYYFTAGTNDKWIDAPTPANIIFTTDGNELTNITGTALAEMTMTSGTKYYIKSSSDQTVTISEQAIANGTYYLYSPYTNLFLSRGANYGTAAVVDKYGIPFNLTLHADGYTLQFVDDSKYLYGTNWLYADGATGDKFKIVESTVNSYTGYAFYDKNSATNNRLYIYTKDNSDKFRVAGNAIVGDNCDNEETTIWVLKTISEHNTMVNVYPAENMTNVITAAGMESKTNAAGFETYLSTYYDADDVTSKMGTATFGDTSQESGSAIGDWTWTEISNWSGSVNYRYGTAWAWQRTGSYTQTVSADDGNLPAGIYKVEMGGFDRHATEALDATFATNYGTLSTSYLKANNEQVRLKAWADVTGRPTGADTQAASINNGNADNVVYVYLDGSTDLNLTVCKPTYLVQCYFNFGNFRLTRYTLKDAVAADYTALNTAINAHTIGFEDDEYAPYNNLDAMAALATAQAIDQESTNTKESVDEAITALTDATWIANDGDVECVYNGDFAIGQGSSYTDIQNYGWSRTNAWGQFHNDSDKESTSKGTSYYNQPGSLQYGNAGYYTMPLKANTIYTLIFKYASWVAGSNNSVTASVLNSGDGMAATVYGQNTTVHTAENAFVTKTIKFVTGTAGNYILTLANSGNTVMTDVSITKDANQYLEFADGSVPTYAPGTYPSVKITRSLTANRWATAVYPFAVSGVDKIAVLNDYNTTTQHIKFVSAEASTANEPFLMRSTTDKSEISLSNVEVSATAANPTVTINNLSLIGSYSQIEITSDGDKNYVLSDNTIYPVGEAKATIPVYRAYIQDANTYSLGRSLKFVVDEEVTAIEGISDKNYVNGTVYNLNGQVVRKNASTLDGLKKGVYIVNGQRVIVK